MDGTTRADTGTQAPDRAGDDAPFEDTLARIAEEVRAQGGPWVHLDAILRVAEAARSSETPEHARKALEAIAALASRAMLNRLFEAHTTRPARGRIA